MKAPAPLVQLHLAVDGSGSVCDSIDAVNDGIAMLAVALRRDAIAADSVDITLIRFGDTVDLLAGPTLARDFTPPVVHLNGLTQLGGAIETSLDIMKARALEYRTLGFASRPPWLILITDGCATDHTTRARLRLHKLIEQGRVCFQAFGIPGADMDALRALGLPVPSPPLSSVMAASICSRGSCAASVPHTRPRPRRASGQDTTRGLEA